MGTSARRASKGRLGRDHAGRHYRGIVRAGSRPRSACGHPGWVPAGLACPRHAHRSRIPTGHCRAAASPHHGIARRRVRSHRRSTHDRVSRRIRLDDRHRPRNHGTSLAGCAAQPPGCDHERPALGPRPPARLRGEGARPHHQVSWPPRPGTRRNAASQISPCDDGPAPEHSERRSHRAKWASHPPGPQKQHRAPRHRAPGQTVQGYALRGTPFPGSRPCRASIQAEASNHLTNADLIGPAYMVLFTPYTMRGSIPPGPHSCRQNRFTRRNVKSPDARTSRYIP